MVICKNIFEAAETEEMQLIESNFVFFFINFRIKSNDFINSPRIWSKMVTRGLNRSLINLKPTDIEGMAK